MLYVLATPLGNLADLSKRAMEILKTCSLIIAENPGYSRRLFETEGLKDLGRGKKFIQYAEHNELKAIPKIIGLLKTQDAILLSDAGTPSISDPGFKLVREAIKNSIRISPIPGPTALISALCASGLPTDKFVFLGFLPKTEIKMLNEIEKVKNLGTIIFYESPHRIKKTFGYIAAKWPEAQTVIARELTKVHEEFIRGTAKETSEELQKRPSIKGELTVLLNFRK